MHNRAGYWNAGMIALRLLCGNLSRFFDTPHARRLRMTSRLAAEHGERQLAARGIRQRRHVIDTPTVTLKKPKIASENSRKIEIFKKSLRGKRKKLRPTNLKQPETHFEKRHPDPVLHTIGRHKVLYLSAAIKNLRQLCPRPALGGTVRHQALLRSQRQRNIKALPAITALTKTLRPKPYMPLPQHTWDRTALWAFRGWVLPKA